MLSRVLLCVLALLVQVHARKKFDLCCHIAVFKVKPCMISDSRIIDMFTSKKKVDQFPIMNDTSVMECTMVSSEKASYYVNFHSEQMSLMEEPTTSLPTMGIVDNLTKSFNVNFTCKETVRAFVQVDVKLTYPSDQTEEEFQFYLAKNCSLPGPVIPASNPNAIILYGVIGALGAVLILVVIISLVCYLRIRRRAQNQKIMEGTTNGYAPLPMDSSFQSYRTPPYHGGPPGVIPPYSQASVPSLQSSQKPPHGFGYSSGEGSFMSEPLHSKAQLEMMGGMPPPPFRESLISPKLQIHPSSVVFDTFLKSGTMGITYLATYTRDASLDQRSTVFAKTLKEDMCSEMTVTNFHRDAVEMDFLAHPNILSVTGIVDNGPAKPPIAIFPFMKGGNLFELLHMARPTPDNPSTLTLADQIHMMICIARGMEFLSKHYVHRDLAARNCVVGNDLVVKIADKTLAMDFYPNDYHELPDKPGRRLPVKWLPPEVLTRLTYSKMSDVWSFGVTFWEVLTFGEPPYIDVQPKDMVDHLDKGWRLMQPSICTDELFALIVRCWNMHVWDRSPFSAILSQLESLQCKSAMGLYRPSALETIIKQSPNSPCTTPLSDSDQIQV